MVYHAGRGYKKSGPKGPRPTSAATLYREILTKHPKYSNDVVYALVLAKFPGTKNYTWWYRWQLKKKRKEKPRKKRAKKISAASQMALAGVRLSNTGG